MRTRRSTSVEPQAIPREYADKWLAWSEDGLRIVVVADTLEECRRAVVAAGHDLRWVAIERVPTGRFRGFEVEE